MDFLRDHREALLYSIPLTSALFAAEVAFRGWKKSTGFRLLFDRNDSSRMDLLLATLNIMHWTAPLAALLSFGAGEAINRWSQAHIRVSLTDFLPPGLARGVTAFVVADLAWYWKHRLEHRCTPLWRIHEVHHSATEMNWITGHRLHPLDFAVEQAVLSVPYALIGVSFDSFLVFRVFSLLHSFLVHGPFDWGFGRFGDSLLLSPRSHRVHHSTLTEHLNRNFCGIFPVWDRLFGTAYGGEASPVLPLQVNGTSRVEPIRALAAAYFGFWTSWIPGLESRLRFPSALLRKETSARIERA